MPLNMFVFPVREDIELPEIFVQYAQIPEKPAALDPVDIEESRRNLDSSLVRGYVALMRLLQYRWYAVYLIPLLFFGGILFLSASGDI